MWRCLRARCKFLLSIWSLESFTTVFFTVSERRRIDPNRRELHSTDGCLLFSCFLDLGLMLAMLATAVGEPLRPETSKFYQSGVTGATSICGKSLGRCPRSSR